MQVGLLLFMQQLNFQVILSHSDQEQKQILLQTLKGHKDEFNAKFVINSNDLIPIGINSGLLIRK